jgi:hypothetical protein
MKCEVFCAKRWSNACAAAFSEECRYRSGGGSEFDALSEEEWLTDCNVDCNGTQQFHSVALICWLVVAVVSTLHFS